MKTNNKPNLIDASKSNEKPKIIPHPNLMVKEINNQDDEESDIEGKEE